MPKLVYKIDYIQNLNIKEFTFSKEIIGGSEQGNLSAKQLRRIRRKQRKKDQKQQERLSAERQDMLPVPQQETVHRELTPKQLRRIRKKQRKKEKKQQERLSAERQDMLTVEQQERMLAEAESEGVLHIEQPVDPELLSDQEFTMEDSFTCVLRSMQNGIVNSINSPQNLKDQFNQQIQDPRELCRSLDVDYDIGGFSRAQVELLANYQLKFDYLPRVTGLDTEVSRINFVEVLKNPIDKKLIYYDIGVAVRGYHRDEPGHNISLVPIGIKKGNEIFVCYGLFEPWSPREDFVSGLVEIYENNERSLGVDRIPFHRREIPVKKITDLIDNFETTFMGHPYRYDNRLTIVRKIIIDVGAILAVEDLGGIVNENFFTKENFKMLFITNLNTLVAAKNKNFGNIKNERTIKSLVKNSLEEAGLSIAGLNEDERDVILGMRDNYQRILTEILLRTSILEDTFRQDTEPNFQHINEMIDRVIR